MGDFDGSSKYWQNRWEEEDTPWRREDGDDSLRWWLKASGTKSNNSQKLRAFVPLCGDSHSVADLMEANFNVTGIDVSKEALTALINSIPSVGTEELSPGKNQLTPSLSLHLEDIFEAGFGGDFDLIFDRAALVALAPSDRRRYAELLSASLAPNGTLLIEVYSSKPLGETGPPFKIPPQEVARLFSTLQIVEQRDFDLESDDPEMRKFRHWLLFHKA